MTTHPKNRHTTHFGYDIIPKHKKAGKVAHVFDSVAQKYDMMNDCMSFGVHRLWKQFALQCCRLRTGKRVLDLAGGTGDLTMHISPIVGERGKVVLADINPTMLTVGRDRLINRGLLSNVIITQADAEQLPFANNIFDCVIISFGLRNVTNKTKALHSIYRVLKTAGRLVILEFSHPRSKVVKKIYDLYSFKIIPWLGKRIVRDQKSYRYLVESIRMHPTQKQLLSMMESSGFESCQFYNLSNGIAAVHIGNKC